MENIREGLYIVNTPIGNLNDISLRAKYILKSVDFIICENPKHSLKLLNNLGIKKKLYSLHDYNEEKLIEKLEKHLDKSSIALISDSGAPLISDPGYKLVQNFIHKNFFLTTIPGPSSIISAVQLSGLPISTFVFLGFAPKKNNAIKQIAEKIKKIDTTSVLFISGKHLENFLKIILDELNNRKITICKELTKKNENIFRGNIRETLDKIKSDSINLKGEFTLILEGEDNISGRKINSENKKEIKKILKKFSLTETVEIVHKLSNISKKEIYKMALILKDE